MNKKALSESDICDRYISPALVASGWDKNRWRREYFTAGKIIVRGKMVGQGKKKFVDYLLFYTTNLPIAIVEAKDNKHRVGDGMQQALVYSEMLDVPFVFTSNGDGFVFHDRTGQSAVREQVISLADFPSPEELWERYKKWKALEGTDQALVLSPNHSDSSGKKPRYYQQIAINRTVDAIAKGQQRVLLTMATGTGKTYTAFNIMWRLWKSGTAKRILFLADRNVLVNQARINDFAPFGDSMTKLNRGLVDKDSGRVNTSFEIYLSLYQAIIGSETAEAIYDKFPPDFFDLIIIDECHRGSADKDSAWRVILDYFSSAVHLGMTATPRETKYVSNIDYFGEPVYSYSLKQGIEDGFLAPFKVVRVDLNVDLEGWEPDPDETDDFGVEIEGRVYNRSDIDKSIIFTQRDQVAAERISEFLHETNPMNKTIVFCENIDHAERMRRAIINVPKNAELVEADRRYVMRITGDSPEGQGELDNFIDPKKPYPVVATTSKLMSTGVDAQTCHVVVLDQTIKSMTEFKQTIGRGTRLRTDYDKYFFTILDFRGATDLFSDPDWDGPPIQAIDYSGEGPLEAQGDPDEDIGDEEIEEILDDGGENVDDSFGDEDGKVVYVVSGAKVVVIAERVQFYDKDGKLITESLRDYTRKAVQHEFASLDEFLHRWSETERKQAIIDELVEHGVILEALADSAGRELSAFDLICHVAFDQPPLTRAERANNVKKRDVFARYGEQARAVLEALLDKFADQGVEDLDEIEILQLDPFTEIGTPIEIVRSFGGRQKYLDAVNDLSQQIYKSA